MKHILFILILLILAPSQAFTRSYKLKVTNYYSMASDLETRVTKWDGTHLNLKIVEIEDADDLAFPIGTEFIGTVIEKKAARRFNRDESMLIQVSSIKLPNGQIKAEDLKFNLHARGIFNSERIATTVIGATALTLGTVFDATVVGLPISRGGYGVWYSVQGIRNREEDSSRLKAGLIGFAKGVVFPIPQLIGKGRNLSKIAVGSRVTIDEESKGKSIDAYLKA